MNWKIYHQNKNSHVLKLSKSPFFNGVEFFNTILFRQLLSDQNTPPLPWLKSAPSSPTKEIHKLITADLQEDSSGDEYIPGNDEVAFCYQIKSWSLHKTFARSALCYHHRLCWLKDIGKTLTV